MGPVSRRELIRRLRKLGFQGPYGGGKHSYMRRDRLKVHIPNVHDKNQDIRSPLLDFIIKEQAGISAEEWESTKD